MDRQQKKENLCMIIFLSFREQNVWTIENHMFVPNFFKPE